MASVKTISIVVASTVGALATAGGVVFVLVRHAPARRAIRESEGWKPIQTPSQLKKASRTTDTPARPAEVPPVTPRATPIESADPTPKPGLFGAAREIIYEFIADDVMTQAAALAFYTGLAIAPLLTMAVWCARTFLPSDKKYDVGKAFSDVMGPQAYKPIETLLNPAGQQAPTALNVAGLISIALVAFSASGVFGQVQSALNGIWHVQARPTNGVVGFLRKRVLSLGMLASLLFLLMASLVVSVVLSGLFARGGNNEAVTIVSQITNNVVSIGLFTVLFAALFKFVPDAKIQWRPVWIGAFISALLFTIGKFGLGFYLGRSDYDSSYEAFGSFVAMLVWVYYSAVIVLIGAEVTEITARRLGHALEPVEHAVRVKQVEVGA